MSKYQITLTPVDKYFFGGDMTFAIKGQDAAFESQYVSYIIQSSMFPQQTSLLGMLRFLILKNAGDGVFKNNQIVDKDKAKELIGGQSFNVNDSHEDNDFKLIKNLSHVRLHRTCNGQTEDLEFAPLLKDINFEKATIGSYNLNNICIPSLSEKEYEAKKGLCVVLTNGEKTIKLDEVFLQDRRVGINRDIKTGIVDDGALFKQISYRFNNKEAHYCFVFDVEVEDALLLEKYSGQMVSIGGDNSQFVIGISKEVKANEKLQSFGNAIWILSPTFLTREDVRTAQFAVTRIMSFRFLKSTMKDVTSYHILSKQLTRSEKYELYAPGSMFFFENEKKKLLFEQAIKDKKEFRQIGYNEYK